MIYETSAYHREGDTQLTLETFKDAISRSHNSHSRSVEIYLKNSIMVPADAPDEAQKAERRSDIYLLRAALLRLAERYCCERALPPGSKEALAAFDEANRVADAIADACFGLPYSTKERAQLSPEQVERKPALRVPPRVQHLVRHVKKHGKLDALQENLSAAVGDYAKSYLKSEEVDRILLQALTHVEIVAFIDDMIWKNELTGTSKLEDAAPPSVLRALWSVSKLVFWVWLISAGIVASPLVIPALPFNGMLLAGAGLAVVGTLILVFLGALGVAVVVKEKPRKRKHHQSILDMIDRMNGFYLEFRGSGPFSLSHFKKRVNELADTGVIWPSGLFVLIEDMEARGIRAF
jgi:hypothetical protein